MPVEYSWLVASLLLYGVMIFVQAAASNLEHTPKRLAGPRDDVVDQRPMTGRCKRANQNMVESLLLFAPLVLIAGQLGRFDDMTAFAGLLFFASRLVYAPFYWFGVPLLRTLAWLGGMIAIFMVLSRVLPFFGA
jgi:uncharacterized MAPEG superfamily protein